MPHHTKEKGDLGVLKAHGDLASQGFTILLPLTEHAPFDLVAYKNGGFLRVQVRYCSPNLGGRINVRMRSVWNDRHGTHRRPMNKAEVDLVCAYCPATDACYYFDPREVGESLNLRLSPTRNGQRQGVKYAAAYRLVPEKLGK